MSNFLMDARQAVMHRVPDRLYLQMRFRHLLGQKLNLKDPKTFNEKLQWLKLYNRRPEYTALVDKEAVKKIVAKKIGVCYVIPTLDSWRHFDEIDFDQLPKQFVLKCTHDSGGLVICQNKDKLDRVAAKEKIERCLKNNFYYSGREWPYKNVPHRILAEQYMESKNGELPDYKMLCFGGKARFMEIHRGRYQEHHTQDIYQVTPWKKTEISQPGSPISTENLPKPAFLPEMIRLSETLAAGIPHIRVDWYEVDGKLYFGELTFFDGSGFAGFENPEDDRMLGSYIDLTGLR